MGFWHLLRYHRYFTLVNSIFSTVFAEWWVENTGEIIEELPDPNPPKGKKVATASKKPEVQTKPDDGYQQISLFGMGALI